MTTTTRETETKITEARKRVSEAASEGYAAFMAAKAELAAIEAELPSRAAHGYVVGETYAHRKELHSLGMRWDAGHRAWVGEVDPADLPRGCALISHAAAALNSMNHADSAY
jgi:hypothetical protein